MLFSGRCPTADELTELLSREPDDAQAELEAHLEQCPDCRTLMDQLAGQWPVPGGTALLQDESERPGPVVEQAMLQLIADAQPLTDDFQLDMQAPVSLDFLEASANEKHLGRLGRYEIMAVIGQGGMGVVLKGLDTELNRLVAIKVLHPALAASPIARRRFRRESQAAAAVSHDHVVTIHGVDEINGLPVLVMEYVTGESLQDRIKRVGALETADVLRIAMQTANGLAAAHAQGLIHRDIKPGNILLENGVSRVKITDFGLARAIDDVSITRTGVIAGTPDYMSPEQSRSEPVDHRSDLFSLGSVMYSMCTGRPPFRGTSTPATLKRVCDDEPRPIRDVNPDIPEWLVAIIQRLMSKHPDDRRIALPAEGGTGTAAPSREKQQRKQRSREATALSNLLGDYLADLQNPTLDQIPSRELPTVTTAQPEEVRTRPDEDFEDSETIAIERPRQPQSSRRRRLLQVAAALVLCVVILSVTDATGVTNVRQAVTEILIPTSHGTLVIEVDSPEVSVRLDGDEVVLSGVGMKELRIPKGEHSIDAYRNGQLIQRQLVSVKRGGREVVSISHRPKKDTFAETIPVDLSGLVLHLPMDTDPPGVERVPWLKPVADRDEVADHALEFPNRGYLRVADNSRLDTDEEFTLAAWVRPAPDTQRVTVPQKNSNDELHWAREFLLAKWLTNGCGDYIFAIVPTGQLVLFVANTERGYLWDEVLSDGIVPRDRWTHVAATFNKGKLNVFLNGRLVGSKQSKKVLRTTRREYEKDDIYVGSMHNIQYAYNGAMDDVCIFNRALTESAIADLMRMDSQALKTRSESPRRTETEFFSAAEFAKHAPKSVTEDFTGFKTGRLLKGIEFDGFSVRSARLCVVDPQHVGINKATDNADSGALHNALSASLYYTQDATIARSVTDDVMEVVFPSGVRAASVHLIAADISGMSGPTTAFVSANDRDGKVIAARAVRCLNSNKAGSPAFYGVVSDVPIASISVTNLDPGDVAVLVDRVQLAPQEDATAQPQALRLSKEYSGHSNAVRGLAISPDGELFASGEELLRVVNIKSGEVVFSHEGFDGPVRHLDFSPDGRRLVSAHRHGMLRIWDVPSGELLREWKAHNTWVGDVQFSPNGRQLVSVSYSDEGCLWDADTGRQLARVPTDGNPRACCYSPSGDEALIGGAMEFILIDTRNGRERRRFDTPFEKPLIDVQFLPDGQHVLASAGGLNLALVNLETERVVCRYRGHTRNVESLALLPDGRRFLSGGFDGSVWLWDLETERPLAKAVSPDCDVAFVAVSPDGRFTITAGGEIPQTDINGRNRFTDLGKNTIRRWELPQLPPLSSTQGFSRFRSTSQTASQVVQKREVPRREVGGSGRGADSDWPMWGGTPLRNNVVLEHVPAEWDIGEIKRGTGEWDRATARNVKWVAKLGSQTYGNPVVSGGRVFVGTNNGAGYLKRYPSNVDLGVLLCFSESDGEFQWQYSAEKLPTGRVHDWPQQGICSAPLIEGDRMWFVDNRGRVVCLDTAGYYDGEDDGDFVAEQCRLFAMIPGVPDAYKPQYRSGLSSGKIAVSELFRAHKVFPFSRAQRLERNAKQDAWTITTRTSSGNAIYRLEEDGYELRAFAENGDEPLFVTQRTVLRELDESIIPAGIRSRLEAVGVTLSDDAVLKPVTPNSEWLITDTVDGSQRAVTLKYEDFWLSAWRTLGPSDKVEADVVWRLDMMNELGVSQHNMATCAPAAWGDTLFICTSNGVDETHVNLPTPEAPSFIAVSKRTGKVLWQDRSPGRNILHGQWSAPAVAELGGVPQVIFAGGDGWVYSFRADDWNGEKSTPILLWKFDANPKESKWILGGRGTRNNIIAIPVIHDGLVYIGVGQDPEHGEGPGHLWCIDPTRRGDVSPELAMNVFRGGERRERAHSRVQAVDTTDNQIAVPNPNSAVVWHYGSRDHNGDGEIDFEEEFHRTISSPAIKDGLLFIPDYAGLFHCLDAKTGKLNWTHDQLAACWSSPLIAGNKVYIGDEDGDLSVFHLSSDHAEATANTAKKPSDDDFPQAAFENLMNSSIYTTPIVANGVLYITDRSHLYAIQSDLAP